MQIAIVTGASSGMGREFVEQLARRGEYGEIWAVALESRALDALAERYPGVVVALPLDLTKSASIDALKQRFTKTGAAELGLLVNSAGIARIGDYSQLTAADCAAMIDLNCRALVLLSAWAANVMGLGGRIIELASSSAFHPLQYLSVYAASKAFVLSYSRALRYELKQKGVGVTAVCPYWVGNTNFIGAAKSGQGGGEVTQFPMSLTAEWVVKKALRAAARNRAVVTLGFMAVVQRVLAKLSPGLVMAFWQRMRKK